ncbi:hypothetical protein [Propionivibrio sp.]|uniref:hypothetical protein n=1 Tax=Propionivibrio sp. TaxID=2212460 RepID=UPI003BF26482
MTHVVEARQQKNLITKAQAIAYIIKAVAIIASGSLIKDPSGAADMVAVKGIDGGILFR